MYSAQRKETVEIYMYLYGCRALCGVKVLKWVKIQTDKKHILVCSEKKLLLLVYLLLGRMCAVLFYLFYLFLAKMKIRAAAACFLLVNSVEKINNTILN